jgi:hypothetical protein
MTGARPAASLAPPIKTGFGLRSMGSAKRALSRSRRFTHGRKSEDGCRRLK